MVRGGYTEARGQLAKLETLGVSMDNVAVVLEKSGLASFEASWNELIETVTARLEQAGAKVRPDGALVPGGSEGRASEQPAAAPA